MKQEQARIAMLEERIRRLEEELARYKSVEGHPVDGPAAGGQSQASEQKYQMLFESSADAIFVLDPETGRFLDGNRAAVEISRVGDRYNLLQAGPWDFSPEYQPCGEKSFQLALQKIREAMLQGATVFEWLHAKKNGAEFPALVSLTRIPFGNRDVLMAIVKDITLTRRQAAENRDNEKMLELLFSQSLSGLFFMQLDEPVAWHESSDKEGLLDYIFAHERLTKINQAMLDQYGARESDFLGMTPNELFSHDILAARDVWKEFFDKGRLHSETREKKLDGTPITIEGDYICIYDEQGRITGHFGVQQDVTARKQMAKREQEYIAELKKLNDELEQRVEDRTSELLEMNWELEKSNQKAAEANRAKSIFLANMSHEIRTPMNGVLGMAELLEYTPLNEKQKSYVEALQRSGNTLLHVINDILDYSKIEAGRMQPVSEPFSLELLVDEVVTPYRLRAGSNVELVVALDPAVPANLRGDSFRLQQVISNLLSNAFKFTSSGSVTLGVDLVKRQGNEAMIRFAVTDTGIGISPELQKTIFMPFVQADQTTARQYGGTGLGLAICHQLVELMGGIIEVESGLGKGSAFSFCITFALADSHPTVETAVDGSQDYSHFLVLLAEDNHVNQIVIREYMSKLGAPMVVVANGLAAVNMACRENNRFDLILMDCEMPGMDGYEATRRIREWERRHGLVPTRILALSAHVLPEYIARCYQAGMDGHIAKPIKLSDLREGLESVARSRA